ncbi:unnamed protein product [Clavelina lepadiformis]|uniref:SUMO-activating enzyme subunit n=1 Tax=Clavelina lepadiformis TaxID=159417 RepID=A0ABP0FDS9_CLALP
MAGLCNNALPETLKKVVQEAKLFVVGAGGIGCELLKNLALTGFRNIDVIDLDTIDVSNLNRQFLFQKKHVGLPKAQVARESVLRLCPSANIVSRHDSVFNPEYNMQFFKQFDLVLNALDNTAARNHVNRMCLAADVPLVESGSAGYLGQVTVIKKGLSECYECNPAPRRKTYPGCTIRNTPTELIHCIVWAKYLFNQLFGEEDADQDVSPDTQDPEARDPESGDGVNNAESSSLKHKPIIQRKSTREWAQDYDYDATMIFNKLFDSDINYLLSMDKLWKKRKPPVPLSWQQTNADNVESVAISDIQDVLSVKQNAELFSASVASLKKQLKGEGDGGMLVWDKDDTAAMHFTSAAASIRAKIFDIEQKSIFEVKSMAGNIIPAIATTNAVVAGIIVMQALCILRKKLDECRSVFVCKAANATKKLLVPCLLDPPKPGCYVCAEKPEITIKLDASKLSVIELRDKIMKSALGMLAPDVELLDGRATILISSEEEDNDEENLKKPLSEFGIRHGTRLRADDFLQNYDIIVNILHETGFPDDSIFEIVSKTDLALDKIASENKSANKAQNDVKNEDEDVEIVEEPDISCTVDRKRKHSSTTSNSTENNEGKRRKMSNGAEQIDVDCDVVVLD